MDQTVLDRLLSNNPVASEAQPVTVAPDELVHVVGAQEPVRDQPDDRARMLLNTGWLKIETVGTKLPGDQRAERVAALQQAARAWLKQAGAESNPAERDQVRWLVEKTRPRESKQQIAQRVWLAMVLYGLGHRGLAFDSEGQVLWDGGISGRIGLSPDAALDLAWTQGQRRIYTGSFRQPDGTIERGKGRHRWYIYSLTIDPAAKFLFERRAKKVQESVALIVASESFATQPRLPRDFYGGNEFQQACIDAQDQQFRHILVLSPQHGVVSLDDVVSSEDLWDDVIERRIWSWQLMAVQRLGAYLFGEQSKTLPKSQEANWWAWLNPESVYRLTMFGSGFAVRILVDYLLRAKSRAAASWPTIELVEERPGYDIGDLDEDMDFDLDLDEDDYEGEYFDTLDDLDDLLGWATEFIQLVNVTVPPTGETWTIGADEALIPVRLLSEGGMDIEDFLDLLTDITLLLEQPLPISVLINASMAVSVLLQVTHSLVHNEQAAVYEILDVFPEDVLRQYVLNTLQEPNQEDRLCACLTLAEQLQLIALSIPAGISDQLLTWLQTYLSARMRQQLLGGMHPDDQR